MTRRLFKTKSLNRSDEKLVEMSNGCICCTLREDLLLEVGKLAKDQRFDYLVIESTGISEPLPVAETFTFADEDGVSLSDVATLDTMVTVVDAVNFLKDYEQAQSLQEKGESLGEEDERSVADLLVDQVEFADVILISKTDLVESFDKDRLIAILKHSIPMLKLFQFLMEKWMSMRYSIPSCSILSVLSKHLAGSKRCVVNTFLKQKNTVLQASVMPRVAHSIQKNFISFCTILSNLEN